ncbi:hypothetical protein E2F46_13960 [Luteimonas aestuarii]|uniref:Transmembrane protein n=1 Tax=Luteimonas aestuarii TaxID=453837 RepID=A0A4R5TK97_9GAMM|nr:hypothetical protein [Luteimonas aestuarii]TDK22290.1 hypothetical protein E2F46_13960 [Luteimonas aestuarii]
MNLPLPMGWPGVMLATLIAFAIGFALWWLWRFVARRAGWPEARAIGWACVSAVVVGAGIDSWHLFYLGVAQLESPVYARIALSKIHDPDMLGTRVLLEWAGAVTGVVAGWMMARRPVD